VSEDGVGPATSLVAERVEGEGEEPAGEGDPGDLGAPALLDRPEEVLQRGPAGGRDRRLDQRPAQPAGALLR
jgi:hypothetical protein